MCDGTDLASQDCTTRGMGFDGGTLRCDAFCAAFDTSFAPARATITAAIASVRALIANPAPMFVWAGLIALLGGLGLRQDRVTFLLEREQNFFDSDSVSYISDWE